jgi:serine/threonine protein kinase
MKVGVSISIMNSIVFIHKEYCSPEVLAGNKYQGPELEVWSLGVTLFVLIFFENPFLVKKNVILIRYFFIYIIYLKFCFLNFKDMEDTLRSELMLPQDVSVELESLLLRMLDKDPKTRLTMKEMLAHEWIIQEITNNFDFALIVPCDDHEAHPDIYYTPGQVLSSATALSTSHDSLSLEEQGDESICDDIDDELELNDDFSARSNTRSKTGKNIPKLNCTLSEENAAQSHHLNLSPQCENNRRMLLTNYSDKNSFISPPNLSMVTINVPLTSWQLTTSKSENNIFDKNNLVLPFGPTNFDVVSSLSDLSDDASFYDRRQMNDLSKTTVLNRFSDDDEMGKNNRF